MGPHLTKSLEALTTEIALRATAKVCQGFTPWRIEAIAGPLAAALVDIVIEQGNTAFRREPLLVNSYTTFEIWNQILDEIAKEIPCAGELEIIGKGFSRAERAKFL